MTPATQAAHFIANRWVAPTDGAGGAVELPPGTPGGMMHSGHGREKGFEALLGFTCLKAVAIRHDQCDGKK